MCFIGSLNLSKTKGKIQEKEVGIKKKEVDIKKKQKDECRRLNGPIFELVPSCPHDHEDYERGYIDIYNKKYCCDGNYLFGVKCSVCSILFVSSSEEREKNVNSHMPSTKYPVKVCSGQVEYSFTHSVCSHCFKSKILEHSQKTRRTRH